MKHRLWVAVRLFACATAAAPNAAHPENLLVNEHFPSSLFGWSNSSSCEHISTLGHTAPGAARCAFTSASPNGGSISALRQCVPATAGVAYDLGGFAALAGEADPTSLAYIAITWHANPGCPAGPALSTDFVEQPVTGTSFERMEGTLKVAPPGTRSAEFQLGIQIRQPGTVVAFFDDLFFQTSCLNTPTTLCLTGFRFEVEATFRTPQGQTGPARAVRLTSDGGYFTFFNPDNPELFVKLRDACSPAFDRYWFFAAGLTNVEVEIRVTDTMTKQTRIYTNPLNRPFQAIQDTNAFATCP